MHRAVKPIGRSCMYLHRYRRLPITDMNININFNINISSNFISEKFPSIAKYIEVSFLENKDAFTALEWNSLYELSEQTFVEETESLKQSGAGAGLTDND